VRGGGIGGQNAREGHGNIYTYWLTKYTMNNKLFSKFQFIDNNVTVLFLITTEKTVDIKVNTFYGRQA
jgi:hypothetical protein